MLSLLFVLKFVTYVMSTTTIQPIELRIVGGDEIDITEAPYQVFYEAYSNRILQCGGVIIAKDIVLTAAHCAYGMRPEMLKVRVGSSYYKYGGQVYSVGDLIWHPDFNVTAFMDSDIAILWLSEPLTFSDSVAPIQMMSANEEIPDGELTTVTGWGKLWDNGPNPEKLQRVDIPKVNDKYCIAAFQPRYDITRNMLCAGFTEGGKNACTGDSGGPMVYNNKLAGIDSWSIGCAEPETPGVYTKISALRPWIDKSIDQLRSKHIS